MIAEIEKQIRPHQETLLQHPLYQKIKTPEHLQVFMEHHVFAVWDFMSLLKSLQNRLTSTKLPWVPVGDPEIRYLINEIVLAEETDINRQGQRKSHFEMYLDAMRKAHADTASIETFLSSLTSEKAISETISENELPASVKEFLHFTFSVIEEGKPHKIAASFTFGREDLIPSMFSEIINHIQKNFPEEDLSDFKYYFDRPIELDEDEHGPMALKMVAMLCEDDDSKWQEVLEVSKEALQQRKKLWDGIEQHIESLQFA